MKVLLVATRDVDDPQTGRKLVLRTIMRSCTALGHQVDIAVIGSPGLGSSGIPIPGPGVVQVGANLVRHFLLGRKSLNECLYWSRPAQQRIADLVVSGRYDVVVADMIRTAQFCARLRVPWILDLDDLLSDRYAALAAAGRGHNLLGYFSQRLPAPLRRLAAWAAHRLLRVEARRIASQEVHYGMRADAVTLVSSIEAAQLARRLGRVVHDTAMGIDIADAARIDHAGRHTHAVAFVGGLDYQLNLDAVTHYLEHIAPELERSGCAIALHVVGNAPVALRPRDPFGRTVYLGYVDDLVSTLGRYAVFVAPIVAEGGIKTKVLEAMANGLAVIATEQAVAGLGITPGTECIVTQTPGEFARAIQRLTNDADACHRLGTAARGFVRLNFSHPVLQRKWQVLLKHASANFQECAASKVSAVDAKPIR
ncbi:MAG: glycosyltransferase family 4 protein [Burkholderiaceae bacterium]|nr:glycosyltransferase family 4 protein [Burkholderiaceae bacterium]